MADEMAHPTLTIMGCALYQTCSACPEQYDVIKGGREIGYLRLRHGHFTAEYPVCGGDLVYEAEPEGDGMFDDEERWKYLAAAVAALLAKDDAFLQVFRQD